MSLFAGFRGRTPVNELGVVAAAVATPDGPSLSARDAGALEVDDGFPS